MKYTYLFSDYGSSAAFCGNSSSPIVFRYHEFISAADCAEFDAYVNRCMALSFYDTGVSAHYGDKLISLSTCEYSVAGNRLVVVAKKITEGEAPDG